MLMKNALCFIMGYVVAMETYITLFLSMHFCKVHGIGAINVCTNFEINLYKIDEFRKHANIVFYLTSRDAKTVRRTSWRPDSYDRSFHQQRFPVQRLWLKQWF